MDYQIGEASAASHYHGGEVAAVAEWIGRRSYNPEVLGSNPVGSIIHLDNVVPLLLRTAIP